MKRDIKAVVFDLDGTLIDDLGGIHKSVNAMLGEYGAPPVDTETVCGFVGNGAAKLIARVAAIRPDIPDLDAALAMFIKAYQEDAGQHARAYDGVEATLVALKQRKIPQAVCTNKPGDLARKIVQHMGWTSYFDILIGGGDVARLKPDPQPLQAAMRALDVKPENTLYVGDSQVDVMTAQAADTHFALFNPPHPPFGGMKPSLSTLATDRAFQFEHYHEFSTRITG